MDGQVIAIIISAVGVSGSIGAGFWKLGRSIGSVEGKVEGLDKRMQSYEKQLEGFDTRIDRLDKRINGFLDNFIKHEGKEDGQ
jgi:hypothetical protein